MKSNIASKKDIEEARKEAEEKTLKSNFRFMPKEKHDKQKFCGYFDAHNDAIDYARKVIQNPNDPRALQDYSRHIYGDRTETAMYRKYKGDTAAMTKDATSVLEKSYQSVADYVLFGDNLDRMLQTIGNKKNDDGESRLVNLVLGMQHVLSKPLDDNDPRGEKGRIDPDHDARVGMIRRVQDLNQIVGEKDHEKKIATMRKEVWNNVMTNPKMSDHMKEMIMFFGDREEIIKEEFGKIYNQELNVFNEVFNYQTAHEVIKRDFEIIDSALRDDYITEDRLRDDKRDLLAPDAEAIARQVFEIEDPLNDERQELANKEKRIRNRRKRARRGQGIRR